MNADNALDSSDDSANASDVSLTACPEDREDGAAKIRHGAFVAMHPDDVFVVSVTMKPSAPGAPLPERVRVNQWALSCIVEHGATLTTNGRFPPITPLWYESPERDDQGRTAPIGVAFQVALRRPQIEGLATNPLVFAIEPGPAVAAGIPVTASTPLDGCPTSREDATAKVVDATAIMGKGRQAVAIEYRDEGVLPPRITCPNGESTCDARINRLWERTVQNTRERTCVARWISESVTTPPAQAENASGEGDLLPLLPPFGQAPSTTSALGFALSWEEILVVARHPYVQRISAIPAVIADPQACKPDVTSPIPPRTCPTDRQSIAGKISEANLTMLQAAPGPVDVMIQVSGGVVVCNLSTCVGACPAPDAVYDRWGQENLASQACVRALIKDIGGTASDEVFWIVDAFQASLTWPQIQTVASHPHVVSVEPNTSTPPP